MKTPLDILLPYQRKWVEDDARFKIGMWSRQTGKSFATACETVYDCLKRPGTTWVVLSAGERQALEWMDKAKQWAKAFQLVVDAYDETRDYAEALIKSAEIRFDNGSRTVAIPANPNTARGYSANLVLDEFAFHEQTEEIWRAIYPSISNPLKGELKLRIVSTPNGRGNMFYELWSKNEHYSKHKLTIEDAVAGGLPVDVEELRRAIDDPDAWAQEYMCEFIDSTSVLLPYELIAGCESEEATVDMAPTERGNYFVGVDIGRRHDLTVVWTLEQIGDVDWTREVLELRKVEFHRQLEIIGERVRHAKRAAIDATGIGAMLAEELGRKHGGKVEQCQFTAQLKGEIYTHLRSDFEDRRVRIPVRRDIREDLHAIQKVSGKSGAIRYLAPRSEDGHSDRSTALALARRAARNRPTGFFIPRPFHKGRAAAVRSRRNREVLA